MIDTFWVHLNNDLVPLGFDNRFKDFTNFERRETEAGITKIGNFNNLRVKSSSDGVRISGSLAKYYLGTNQKTLLKSDISLAFNKLSQELGLPIHKAKVNRIDIAENIVTKHTIDKYKPFLGNAKYLPRYETRNSVDYTTEYRTLTLYNKVKEVKKKRSDKLTEIAQQVPLTRVELRIKKHSRLAEMLGLTSVTVEDIIVCYPDLVNAWWSIWAVIGKNRERLDFDEKVFKTKGLMDKQLTMMGIEAMGGLAVIVEIIKSARKTKGLFANKDQAGYLIDKYTRIMTNPKLTEPSKLVEELELKMKIAYFVNTERPQLKVENIQ